MRARLQSRVLNGAGVAALLLLGTTACDDWRDPVAPEGPVASVSLEPDFTRLGRHPVDLCHRIRRGRRYIALTVAGRAVSAHLRHGDALVGDAVPGFPGMIFDEECVPVPGGPRLLAPEEGATLDNGCSVDRSVRMVWDFDWSDVPGATRYHLFVKGSRATYPLVDDESLDGSGYRLDDAAYVIDANRLSWMWRVRALVDGEWGPWSDQRTFDVEPLDTDCPMTLLGAIEWPFTQPLDRDELPPQAVIQTFYNGFFNEAPCTNAETRLADVVLPWNSPASVRTFTSANDPRFAGFVQCLTNGMNEHLGLGVDGVSAWGVAEATALDTGAPDLGGHTITSIRLVVDEVSASPAQGGFTVRLAMRWLFYGG